jgi:hypothetical protein
MPPDPLAQCLEPSFDLSLVHPTDFGAGLVLEPVLDLITMLLRGSHADSESLRDLPIVHAGAHQTQDVSLPIGQEVEHHQPHLSP